MDDPHAGKHAPGEIACFFVNKFYAQGALVIGESESGGRSNINPFLAVDRVAHH